MSKSENIHQERRHLLAGWRFRAMIATIITAVAGYLIFTIWAGWHDVLDAFYRVGWPGILVVPSLSLVNYFLRFLRWQHYLKILGHSVPFLSSLRIYMSGFALTTTPGKTGEAVRSIFLKDYDVPYRQSFGAFLSERMSDLFAVSIISLIGLWEHPQVRLLVFLVIALILFIIFAVQQEKWLKWIEKKAAKLFPSHFAHATEFGIETIIAFRSCYQPSVLLYATVLGIIAWSFEGAGFFYALHELNIHVSFDNALFIYAFSLLIGGVTLLPGGLGGAEFTLLQLLLMHDAPLADAVAATLFIRLSTLWFSVVLGLFCLPKTRH